MLEYIIEKFVKDAGILEYSLESTSINQSTLFNANQCFFIVDSPSTGFSYLSSDVYYNSLFGKVITSNTGFIEILTGNPTLTGYLLTATKYDNLSEKDNQITEKLDLPNENKISETQIKINVKSSKIQNEPFKNHLTLFISFDTLPSVIFA